MKTSVFKIAAVTAIATLGLAGGGAYFLGYLGNPLAEHREHEAGQTSQAEEPTLYSCGMHPQIIAEEPGECPICGMTLTPIRDAGAAVASTGERKVLYWRAPMNPTEIYENPGKSNMGMDLVPVYEDEMIGGVVIKIDPVTQQNMGIRTATVTKGPLVRNINTYGHITYDETRTAQVNPRYSGWIEKLYVDVTGSHVRKGEPLFAIYSPELDAAQEEYLIAYRSLQKLEKKGVTDLLESARRRLMNFGVAKREIARLEKSGSVEHTITIRSPFTGVVTHKNAVEGAFVKKGAPVYQIANLERVWVEAHIFEYELPWVKVGQAVEMKVPYLPGKSYTGRVAYVYPYMQKKTRDVVVRLEFDNPELALKPDMYADVVIKNQSEEEGFIVPSEAVIRSGVRNVVFVTRGDGKFTPRDVELGLALDDGFVQVLTGVVAGEEVVVSGQFLLDSESKLKEAVLKMLEAKAAEAGKDEAEDDFFSDVEEKDDFFNDLNDK
jgi:RND family efflux transporter MFP subunit